MYVFVGTRGGMHWSQGMGGSSLLEYVTVTHCTTR